MPFKNTGKSKQNAFTSNCDLVRILLFLSVSVSVRGMLLLWFLDVFFSSSKVIVFVGAYVKTILATVC